VVDRRESSPIVNSVHGRFDDGDAICDTCSWFHVWCNPCLLNMGTRPSPWQRLPAWHDL
jgi:hypothetical protein